MSKHADVVLLLGCNMGNCMANVDFAKKEISNRCGNITAQSSVYKTSAWGFTEQPSFLNQALQISTRLSPEELLHELKNIETSAGRIATEKWQQRCLDIDILFYSNQIINLPHLTVPHKNLHERRFTLVPLHEILPAFLHPVLNKTIAALLDACDDKGAVEKLTPAESSNA